MTEADGVSGPLIVHPKKPPAYEYDEDVVVFLQDFYGKVTAEQQQVGLMSFPFVWVGNPDSILIGGKGIANKCEILANNSDASVSGCIDGCASDPLSQLMTIKVETGKVYLLRFISSTSLVILNIAIGGHNLTIVEEDTTPIEPIYNVPSFNIGPGQRYVALLNATQPSGSYWLEATVAERDIPNVVGRAIIQYDADEAVLPMEEPYHPPWNSGELCPNCGNTINPKVFPEYVGLTTPESEITRYTLVVSQVHDIGEDGKQTGLGWGVNNVSFAFTTSEPLIQMAVRAAKENGWPSEIPGTIDLPRDPPTPWNYTVSVGSSSVPNAGAVGVSVIRANKDQVIDIVLQNSNEPTDTHQWHMHGHSFWVIGQGEGVFNPEVDVPKFNLKNPGLRDTVTNWPNGWTAIRVTASNPGVWFFHCHILPHLQMGMAVALVVQADEIANFPDESASVQYCTMIDSLDIVSTGWLKGITLASVPMLFAVSTFMFIFAY